MTTARFMLLFTLLLIISLPAFCADLPKNIEDDYWMGAYYGDTRVGYQHTVIKHDTFEGKPVIVRHDDLVLRLKSDGKPVEFKISRALYVGSDYLPVVEIIKGNDPIRKTNSDGQIRYAEDSFKVTMVEGDAEPKSMTAPLDEDDKKKLVASCKYNLGVSELKVGDKFKVSLHAMDNISFAGDGFTWNVTNCELEVLREEEVSFLGKPVKSLVVKQTQTDDVATIWCSASGQTYKIIREQRNVAFVCEPMADAMNVPEGAGPDVGSAQDEPGAENNESKVIVAQPRDVSDISKDYWMGVFYENTRIGYTHVVVKKGTYENKEVLCKLDNMRLRYRTAEAFYDNEIRQALYVGDDFLPVAQFVSIVEHPGDEPKPLMSLRCDGKTVDMSMSYGESKPVQSSEPIDKETRELYTSAAVYELGLAKLNVGSKFGIWNYPVGILNDSDGKSNLHWQPVESEIEVIREETLPDSKKGYVVTEKSEGDVATNWFDESGQLSKQQHDKSGITLIREPKEKVLEIEKGEIPLIGGPAQVTSRDYWMGIYYGDTKIGYMHTTIGPSKYQGNDVLQRQDYLKCRYIAGGLPIRVELTHTLYADGFFMPIRETIIASDSESRQYDSYLAANYTADGIDALVGANELTAQNFNRPYVDGEKEGLVMGAKYSFTPNRVGVGSKYKTEHFIIHGIRIKDSRLNWGYDVGDCELEGLRKETLKVGDTEYQTIVVSERFKGDMITSYFTENGEEVRRMDRVNNILFIREDKEKATEIDKGDGPDIGKLIK